MACAVHDQRIPPSGFAHGAVLHLTHADARGSPQSEFSWPVHRGRLVCHAVLARDDLLRIFEVRVQDDGTPHFVQVRMHKLFGEVTGYDGRDRVLLSFRDAKISLLEWNDAYGDLQTVSIHTFERAQQLAQGLPHTFVPALRADPASQCAALLLPEDAIAILPLYQDMGEVGDDVRDSAQVLAELPYAPSFVLALCDIDAGIKNVRDMCFLPRFQKPTLALLYEPVLTWTGSLSRARQTMRVCLVTLDLTISYYPVTVTSEALPYDCLYLAACPESLGGVMIVTPSAIMHMDQTGRIVGTAVSGWYEKTAPEISLAYAEASPLDLQSSQLVFCGASDGLLFLAHGEVFAFWCLIEGRSVTSVSLAKVDTHGGAPRCAFAARLPEGHLFCASLQSDSVLYEMQSGAGSLAQTRDAAPHAPISLMSVDDEDADAVMLYGESSRAAPSTVNAVTDDEIDLYGDSIAATVPSAELVHSLRAIDRIPALCGLTDIAMGDVRDHRNATTHRTVVALHKHLGTLEMQLRSRVRKTIAPAQRVWATAHLYFCAWDEECIVYTRSDAPEFVAQLGEHTVACGTSPDGSALRVSRRQVSRVANDGHVTQFGARQSDAEIVCARMSGAVLALCWSDGRVSVFVYRNAWGEMALEAQDTYALVDVYVDPSEALGASTLLVLATVRGHIELYTLADGALQWRSKTLCVLPSRLNAARDEEKDEAGMPLHALRLCTLGDTPTLCVQYENGQVAVYEARPTMDDEESVSPFAWTLGFVRLDVRMLGALVQDMVPFVGFGGHACIALPGEHAMFLVRDPKGPVQWLEPQEPLFAFSPLEDDWRALCVQNAQGVLVEWEACALDALCPYTRWSTGRSYTRVACHDETGALAAASVQQTDFVLYNEEDEPVQDPRLDPTPTQTARGAVELFARLGDAPVHGYEFGVSETVTALHMAPLDAIDRMAGRRTFLVVGTSTNLGEDRPAKGHLYVFDIIATVPYGNESDDALQLKCLCREELRAPVTALNDLNGYLVVATGQKLLIRSFEYMLWLVTIAFLDTAFYTTDIQRVKNYLLLTDYHRGAYFVAYQEDPSQLHLLGRDYGTACLTHGAFLVHREKLTLATQDMYGCLRLVDYNPSNPTSFGGQRLLTRTEYHTAGHVARTLLLRGPRNAATGEIFSSEVLLAKHSGAVELLVPVEPNVFQILQLFQSQLVRSVRHAAGLNPRAHRAVQNTRAPRPLTKGILDRTLLHAAEEMSRPKLVRLVEDLQVRTGIVAPDDLLECLVHLEPQW
ncbi:Cft1p [Malassezia vespertilionis]|uniref:Cft1p n=1 Tax=Malassezia vespertilionis TaxID=2020962 RepID=A0A2N1JDR8_9BASI|nr:Cft1p [Malassezia vespertilionis]